MKVTHIIESTGGSADFMLYLVRYLPHHAHTIIYGDRTFVTFGSKFENLGHDYPDVTFLHWKYIQREISFLKDIRASLALYKLLRNLESDIIHLHSSKAGFIGRLVCFILGRRNVIYTPNGLSFLRLDVSPFKRKIYLILERFADMLKGRVVSCSKSEADELIKRGIPSTYINNGTVIFENEPKFPGSEIIIATIGRAAIQKDPALFNEIAMEFLNFPAIRFLWIGGGELEHTLTSPNIIVTGWMERSVVLKELKTVDIYLSTALWEGLPFAVIEAMNLCKPVILRRCVGNIDLVTNNGFIFSNRFQAIEKLNELIRDPELRIENGRNSHLMAQKYFNVELMAEQYEAEYLK